MKKYLAVYYCRKKRERFLGNAGIEIDGNITSEAVMTIEEELKKNSKSTQLILLNLIPLDGENEVEE